jgi:hypothetical protein
MTDHNARQAGLTEIAKAAWDEAWKLAFDDGIAAGHPLGRSYLDRDAEWADSDVVARLAAHSADARNGEGVAVELIELLRAIRPEFGAVGSRDVDVRAQQNRIDRAIELLAAPAAPAPKDCFATGECSNVIHHCRDLPNCEPKARMKAAPAPAAQADERVALGKWSEECKKWGHPATPEARAAFIDGYRARQQPATTAEPVQACNCRAGDCDGSCAPYIGQQPAPAAQAAQGWKLVPVEPTDEMVVAFAEAWFSKVRPIDDCMMNDAYAAMLDAAPAAPDAEPAKSTPPECTCPSGNGSLRHPCPVHAVAPVAQWEDLRVQRVYEILCADETPPKGEHWEGFAARRIVDNIATPAANAIATLTLDFARITNELRCYNRAADAYKGEHIHKVWAREIDNILDTYFASFTQADAASEADKRADRAQWRDAERYRYAVANSMIGAKEEAEIDAAIQQEVKNNG